MTPAAVAAAEAARPRARGRSRASVVRYVVGSGFAVGAAILTTTAAIAYETKQVEADGGTGELLVLWWLIGVWLAIALLLRTRVPVAVCLAAAVGAVLMPIEPLAALIALTWVIARRSARVATACGAVVAVAVGATLWRDHARSGENVLFSAVDQVTGDRAELTVPGYVVVGLLYLGVAVCIGLVRRWAEAAREADETAREAVGLQRQQEHVAEELRTEMTRQEEREVIAREVHDTVAHHLSLVSLQASALEVTASGDDGEMREAARAMRSAAHQALEEMRDLIAVLRDPRPHVVAGGALRAGLRLGDLPTLVDTAREAGARIRASVFVSDADRAPAALNRAVYRIVQESLTNVLKHAPGAEVEIDLRAAPGAGVDLRVANTLPVESRTVLERPPDVQEGSGTGIGQGSGIGEGSGIVGMRERAVLLGGTLDTGVEGEEFVVVAHLPWAVVSDPPPSIGAWPES